jgi:hypothetical protein
MDDQSRNYAAENSHEFRSFAVEAFIGHRASGWPLASFDISSRELRVRLSYPWFTTRSQQGAVIRAVVVACRFGDSGGFVSMTMAARWRTCTSTRSTVVSRSLTSCNGAVTTLLATPLGEHLAGTGGKASWPRRLPAITANIRSCRCDTRSHLASELADWRADFVGRVVPGACSRPAPPCRALPVTAGCGAQGNARGSSSHPGITGKGQTGRVNRVNLR